jgi:hypothetical protein
LTLLKLGQESKADLTPLQLKRLARKFFCANNVKQAAKNAVAAIERRTVEK